MERVLADDLVVTPEPSGEDPSRTGALWVGATGVVMLLAAASVLTAVRWDDIGQSAKLGSLVAITLMMLFGGKRLESMIPQTARTIFHLGALLIPFDMAAVAILANQTWQQTLLLTSLSGVASWYALQALDDSVVLRWAARCSVVFAAAGVAAVSPVAMVLGLALVAVGAAVLDRQHAALLWTAVAGVLPLAALVDWPVRIAEAADDLGFVEADRWQLMAGGIVAAASAAVLTWRKPLLERGWLAVVSGTITAIVGVAMFDGDWTSYLVAGLVFVLLQIGSLAVRNDDEWKPLLDVFMPLSEVLAGVAMATMFVDAIVVASDNAHGEALGLGGAALLFGLGWLTADRRRVIEPNDWLVGMIFGANWAPATFLVPMSAVIATIAVTGSTLALAVTLVVSGLWAVATARSYGTGLAIAAGAVAMLLVNVGWTGLAVMVGAAAVTTIAARLGLRRDDDELALLASGAAACFWGATWVPLEAQLGEDLTLPILAVGAWLLSLATTTRIDITAAHVGRVLAFALLSAVWVVTPWAGLVTCGVVIAGSVFDWLRTERSVFAGIAGVAFGIAVSPLGLLAGFELAETGVLMTVVGMVLVGLLMSLPQRFELPLAVAAVSVTLIGLLQAVEGSGTLAPAIVVTGVSVLLFGASTRSEAVIGLGAVTFISGTWLQLADWQVDWLEAYLALPALVVLWAGREYRSTSGASTWICYAPTIAIFGGLALADRFTGGSAWHAVIAGAVGVVAVIAGGANRLVGPLVTGTTLLALAVGYESLGPASLVPTWMWLALGGSVLLTAAVLMERSETTPLEHGQRVVQVLATRYS